MEKGRTVSDLERGDILNEVDLKAIRDTVQLPDAVYDPQPSDAPGQCQYCIDKGNEHKTNWFPHLA